jgi:uncharacterized UPF0160 family protein
MKKYTVVTHSRNFHLDEVMAIAILDKYLLKGDYELIRTRDSKIISKHQRLEDSFVIDVGFIHDNKMNNFDHHQKGFEPSWDDGTPLSSCGLIWQHLWNKTSLMNGVMKEQTKEKIENDIIKKIDAHDNGMGAWNKGIYILMSNRNHHDDNVMDTQFKRALGTSKECLDNAIYSIENTINKNSNFKIDEIVAISLLNIYLLKDKNSRIYNYDEGVLNKYKDTVGLGKKWDDGTPYSACGLVWDYLWNHTSLMSMNMNSVMKKEMEDQLIKKVDSKQWTEGEFLNLYQRNSPLEQITQNKKAIYASYQHWHNKFSLIKNDIRDYKDICKDIKNSSELNGVVLLSKQYREAGTIIADNTSKSLFIYPHSKGQWIIQTAPKTGEGNFSKKCPMPDKWAGKKDRALESISGVKGLVFCHKSKFMCIFKGNKVDVVNVAKLILSLNGVDLNKKDNLNSKINHRYANSKNSTQVKGHNEVQEINQCIDNSFNIEDIVVLDKNYNESTMDLLKNTNNSISIRPKGESRWIIQSTMKEKFMPKEWKGMSGERLQDASGIDSICSCSKGLNSCVIKGNKDEAIIVAKKLLKFKK